MFLPQGVSPFGWPCCNLWHVWWPCSLSHVLRNYAWHPDCIRQWLWVSKGRQHNGGTWLQRMEHAVKMVFIAVLFGSSVLIHCRQGKHRSGATGCFMFCLLTGVDFNSAMKAYRGPNQRLRDLDMRIVRRCWDENHTASALDYFRGQQWAEAGERGEPHGVQ